MMITDLSARENEAIREAAFRSLEVRHRLAAFRMAEIGAVSFDVRKGIPMGNRGNAPNTTKTTGEST
jgi:hypothetical protein